ncbi:unnamed protein product [Allacma fusca]|uniref:C2H2-type domain-containing protein n=1 Tax=Allacma fusca TaxID=39272 RepID=A0A8J2JS95_9HEXA|nr:unnamed protein product [Allacma fusca]
MPSNVFKCKHCGKFYLKKKDFQLHKEREHKEEIIGNTTSPSPVTTSDRSSSPPPPSPPTRQTPSCTATEAADPPSISKRLNVNLRKENISAAVPITLQKKKISNRNMPLPIGKKRKVMSGGEEVEEWFRNPKFKGA